MHRPAMLRVTPMAAVLVGLSLYGLAAAPPRPPLSQTSDAASASVQQVAIDPSGPNPAALTITRPATVTWRNSDGIAHTVTSDDGRFGPFTLGAGDISPATVFTTTGTYSYHVDAARPLSYTGSIMVTDPSLPTPSPSATTSVVAVMETETPSATASSTPPATVASPTPSNGGCTIHLAVPLQTPLPLQVPPGTDVNWQNDGSATLYLTGLGPTALATALAGRTLVGGGSTSYRVTTTGTYTYSVATDSFHPVIGVFTAADAISACGPLDTSTATVTPGPTEVASPTPSVSNALSPTPFAFDTASATATPLPTGGSTEIASATATPSPPSSPTMAATALSSPTAMVAAPSATASTLPTMTATPLLTVPVVTIALSGAAPTPCQPTIPPGGAVRWLDSNPVGGPSYTLQGLSPALFLTSAVTMSPGDGGLTYDSFAMLGRYTYRITTVDGERTPTMTTATITVGTPATPCLPATATPLATATLGVAPTTAPPDATDTATPTRSPQPTPTPTAVPSPIPPTAATPTASGPTPVSSTPTLTATIAAPTPTFITIVVPQPTPADVRAVSGHPPTASAARLPTGGAACRAPIPVADRTTITLPASSHVQQGQRRVAVTLTVAVHGPRLLGALSLRDAHAHLALIARQITRLRRLCNGVSLDATSQSGRRTLHISLVVGGRPGHLALHLAIPDLHYHLDSEFSGRLLIVSPQHHRGHAPALSHQPQRSAARR